MIVAVDNSGLCRIRSIRPKPSIFGMCMSVKISLKGSPASKAEDKAANAVSPSSTEVEIMSQRFNIPSRILRFVRLSSATRTLTPCSSSAGAIIPTSIAVSEAAIRTVK